MSDLFGIEYLNYVVAFIGAYLLGSISPAILIGRLKGINIKKEGSGNAGTTNALRVLGKKAALGTLAIDVFKGFLAVKIGFLLGGTIGAYVCLALAILGHVYPIFYSFKGGKGVAVAFGTMLAVNWPIALGCLGVVVIVILITRMVSLGSILAGLAFPFMVYFTDKSMAVYAILPAALVIYKHKDNIKRIVAGEESKISFSKNGN